jgi:hypothetical protein
MNLKKMLALVAVGALMFVGSNSVVAQSRGNFDPAQFRQRMTERLREQMDIKDDAEWKAIEGQINKVMDAQRDVMATRFSGFGRGGSRSGGGSSTSADSGSSSSSSSTDSGSSRRSRGGSMFGGEPSPEVEALRKAVDDKAPADEIKAKLAAVKKANKDQQKKLEQAQTDLRSVLSVRQEAVAVLNGLLN